MTTIPTLAQIYAGVISDIETEFGITLNPFGKSALRAIAAVWAACLKLYYLTQAFLQKNIWADTADSVSIGGTLERFGMVKLGRLPFPATAGYYTCTVTGTTGATIPALTQFKSDDASQSPGYLFILDTAYTMPSGTGSITLRALTAGTVAELKLTDTLTSTSPIINVNSGCIVSAITTFPIDAETIEQYRYKVIQAYQLSPQGGAPADYRLWGLDAAGVQQIYPYADSGAANEINIFVEAILSDSVGPPFKGVPTTTILNAVAADIEADPTTGRGRRPLGVFLVNTLPIVPKNVDITINSGGTITTAQQTTIRQALLEGIANIRPFIAGVDNANLRNDTINAYSIGNLILEAVGSVIISAITLDVASTPVTSYLFDNGEIPYLNSVTFI